MSVERKKINDVTIKPLKGKGKEEDKRPIKGKELFDELYPNIAVIARKKSGKTWVIGNILDACAGRDTNVIAFVSTLFKDDAWIAIAEKLRKKGIAFDGYTSIYDSERGKGKKGLDRLNEIIQLLTKESEPVEEEEAEEQKGGGFPMASESILKLLLGGGGKEEEEKVEKEVKVKETPYRAPDYIFVFDDLSDEIKTKSLTTLLKKNRHFKIQIIVSTQYVHDVLPESLKQMDYWIIFGGQPQEKLKKIHKDCNSHVDFPVFEHLYKIATKEKYSFLYVDTRDNTFRQGFNTELKISGVRSGAA